MRTWWAGVRRLLEEATAAAGADGNGVAAGGKLQDGEVAYDHTRSLFLGNLTYNVDEEDIIRLFHRSKEYPELNGSVEAGQYPFAGA